MPKHKSIADIFTCPQCGEHRLEEVMAHVVQTTDIIIVELTDKGLACDYGDCSHDGGVVQAYCCFYCGYKVAATEKQLIKVLGLVPERKPNE